MLLMPNLSMGTLAVLHAMELIKEGLTCRSENHPVFREELNNFI